MKNINESVARLPAACVTDLNEMQIQDHKQSALHDALTELKSSDKGRTDLVMQLHDMEEK